MRGWEGGIPYGMPAPQLVVHLALRFGDRPLCRTTAGHYQTSTNIKQVTCRFCTQANDKESQ